MPKTKTIIPDKLIGTKPPLWKTAINDKDAILYALGVGFSRGK